MIKGNGIIYSSRFYTCLGKSIGLKLNDLNESDTPGPGAYEFFSDFEGFYKYGKNKKKNNKEANMDGKEIDEGEGSIEGNSKSDNH